MQLPLLCELPNDINIVFEAVKGSSQELAINSRAHHTLLCGSRGSMKTATQINFIRKHIGIGYGKFFKAVIIDRHYKDLADIIAQTKKFFYAYDDGAVFMSGTSDCKWKWPTGEEVFIRHVDSVEEYDQFHGWEICIIAFNELNKWPNLDLYNKMKSVNRCAFIPEKDTPRLSDGRYATADGLPLPPMPLCFFSTTNPSGVGHNAIKRQFINKIPYGKVVKVDTLIFNPKTQQEEVFTTTQVAIFASYRENPYLPAKYIADLNSITDPNLRAAWLNGRWDVTSGGAFDDLFRLEKHRIPRFKIPDNWYVDRSFDWGSTHPFSVGWFAEANGETAYFDDGTEFTPNKGSIIQIAEFYGSKEVGTNIGLKMSAPDISKEILRIEKQLVLEGWISHRPYPGPADNQIGQKLQEDVETIKAKMEACGVYWTNSDKSKGSRTNGLILFRDRLESVVKSEGQGFYFMENCVASIELIPSLPRDPKNQDDVDTNSEDHPWDMVRYKILALKSRIARNINFEPAY